MKFLLSLIAVCLVMITAKLYIPEVHADFEPTEEGKIIAEAIELTRNPVFKEAVKGIVTSCYVAVEKKGQIFNDEYPNGYAVVSFSEYVDC
jgi:hypothetical protein